MSLFVTAQLPQLGINQSSVRFFFEGLRLKRLYAHEIKEI